MSVNVMDRVDIFSKEAQPTTKSFQHIENRLLTEVKQLLTINI